MVEPAGIEPASATINCRDSFTSLAGFWLQQAHLKKMLTFKRSKSNLISSNFLFIGCCRLTHLLVFKQRLRIYQNRRLRLLFCAFLPGRAPPGLASPSTSDHVDTVSAPSKFKFSLCLLLAKS